MYKLLIGLGAVILIGGAFLITLNNAAVTPEMPDAKTYTNDTLGISFNYPTNHYLEAAERGDGHRGHFVITMYEDTEENKAVREGRAPGREGPPTITFDLYQSPEEPDEVAWIKGHSGSNYKLGDGEISSTTVSDRPAFSYSWDGLYRAQSVVFKNRDYIVMASVTYLTPQDRIITDFSEVLKSIQLK